MFSLGIDPSTTKMNGAPSVPSAAWWNGRMNSSPPSVGESTLLCRCTFGMPGIAPITTSSMLGSDAFVTEMVSPSQLIPSEVQRMWTSSTPGIIGSSLRPSARCQRPLGVDLDLQRLHRQLLAAHDLDVQPAALRAREREAILH